VTRATACFQRVIAILALLVAPVGCGGGDPIAAERAAEDAARARADAAKAPPTASDAADSGDGQPRARSALGKARERAERLEGEVAEYQKKLEKAADGEFE